MPYRDVVLFTKYQALGNDYLVVDAREFDTIPSPAIIRRICDRNFGAGSDGVLLADSLQDADNLSVRIFNPDGSEAEKSGNGLRILAQYLWDTKRVGRTPFRVRTAGGTVECCIEEPNHSISVEMGRVSFHSSEIPVTGPAREVLDESLEIGEHALRISGATIGNPHCVLILDTLSPRLAHDLGPQIENSDHFPNRTNVQFVRILSKSDIQIEIWERGAGYTLASGSSSCAAAAVAHRLGHCESPIAVHMQGGDLQITLSHDQHVSMVGPAFKVFEGSFSPQYLSGAAQ